MIQTVDVGKLISNTVILTATTIVACKLYGKVKYAQGYFDGKNSRDRAA